MLHGYYRSVVHVPGHLRLRGKVCVMFGVGTDVGATIARVFAIEGCSILAVDEDEDAARELAASIDEDGGFAVPCQATAPNATNIGRELSNYQFRRIDIVIDNWSWQATPAQPRLLPSINPEGLLFCPKSHPLLIARFRNGIDSDVLTPQLERLQAPSVPFPTHLMRHTRHPLRVNAVCFNRDSITAVGNHGANWQQIGTNVDLAIAHQIAQAALFLASDESQSVNGTSITVGTDEGFVGRTQG